MAAREGFGAQIALIVFVAVTASSASSWRMHTDEKPSPPPKVVQKPETDRRSAENSSTIVPSPVLRPLALLANAIGSEPLFVLKTPGNAALSASFRPSSDDLKGCADRTLANAVLSGAEPDVCGVVNAMRRRVGGLDVKIMIATLPDWVDSSLQWTFDPILDAIQMSAAQMGYVLTGFDMADADPDPQTIQPKGSVWPFPRVHEITPGSLLFRRTGHDSSSSDPDMLLILLVGETATAGIHSAAFAAALDLALLWQSPSNPSDPGVAARSVGILGPTYSGSAFSMVRGLKDAAARHGIVDAGHPRFDVVTGSASSPQNPHAFAEFPLASFRATTRSDTEELWAVAHYLGHSRRGWQCGDHMALLVEANTTWGRSVVESLKQTSDASKAAAASAEAPKSDACQRCLDDPSVHTEPLLPCAAVVPFPLHISRLRGASPAPADPENLPSKSAVSLDLSEKLQPVDRIPPETPQITAATVEIMVSGMFKAIQDRQITTIGILATDKRDHLYLAEEIARHRPNVLAFTVEGSLVYLHPDVADYVRGTLVASTYSLSERTQRLTRPLLGQRLPQQFGSSPAHGAFNALAVLMQHPEQLIDYDAPEGLSGKASREPIDSPCRPTPEGQSNGDCSPPVWISVVGRSELLPLNAEQGPSCGSAGDSGRGYALCPGLPRSAAGDNATTSALKSAAACAAGTTDQCRDRRPYLMSHVLFLVLITLLWGGMVAYQVWLQRLLDLWHTTRRTVGTSSLRDWARAVVNLAHSLVRGSVSQHPAAAEFWVSLAAIRGATATVLLWWMKLVMIYFADHYGIAAGELQIAFVAIASVISILVVWQTINAFWSSQGSWRVFRANRLVITLVLALAVVAAVGSEFFLKSSTGSVIGWNSGSTMIILGLIFSALSIFVDPTTGGGLATTTLTRWRRLPALLALGAFVAFALDLMKMNWGAVDTLLYADRTASLSDLVSPAAPIILFSAAMFWWGVWNVRRLQLLNLPEGEVGIGAFLGDRARAAGIDPQFFREPTLTLGRYILLPTIAALVALWYGRRYVGTIDGQYFGEFLLLGAVAIATVMLHALAHAMHLGGAIVNLLKSIARHPAGAVFQVLAKEPVSWRITYRESMRPDLEPLRSHILRLTSALDLWGPAEDRLLPRLRHPKASLQARCRSAVASLGGGRAGRVMDSPLEVTDWRALNRLTRMLNRVLRLTSWVPDHDRQPASASLVRALGEMEYIVVFHASLVLRDLLMRLVSGFTMVIGGILMLIAAHLLYTFEGRVFWLSFDAAAVALSAVFAVKLLVTLERDAILSHLWGTSPGRISLFGGLTWRMVSYGAISLATIFAVLFPELGGQLLNWVAPARAVLSE